MRKIELNFNEDQILHGNYQQLFQAIGRISWRAMDGYETVRIFNDGKNDLIAYYEGTWGKFVMGAVWREESKEYTFHS